MYNKTTTDRRTHSSNTPANINDNDIYDKIDKFQDQLKKECVYRIPVRYFSDTDKKKVRLKINLNRKFNLEIEMNRLFQSKRKGNSNWHA